MKRNLQYITYMFSLVFLAAVLGYFDKTPDPGTRASLPVQPAVEARR